MRDNRLDRLIAAARELSRLDRLIAAAREQAHKVKDRIVAVAQNVGGADGAVPGAVRALAGAGERVQKTSAGASTAAGRAELVPDSEVERRQQAFRERYVIHRTEY